MLLTSALLVGGTGRPSLPTIWLVSDLFVTGPAPDSGGSKPGNDRCPHMPEKSGIDGVLWLGCCVKATDENRVAAAVVVTRAVTTVRMTDFSRLTPGGAPKRAPIPPVIRR